MINDKLKTYMLNFKTHKINKLEIYYLQNFDSSNYIIDKNIDAELFYKLQNKFLNYKNKNEQITIYNYNNNYLTNKIYTKKKIIDKKFINNYLLLFYDESQKQYSDFSCKKIYNKMQYENNKYIINDEIDINFLKNNNNLCIRFDVKLNHNIDYSVKLLNDFLN